MKSAVLILGGGSPKNFMLQTEPQIQEVMGVAEKGHDYFLQVTDARPDTGGLSGATPNEAVSWGKIDPERLPDSVVCYVDSTVALPLITAYALARRKPRKPRRLFEQREAMMARLTGAYEKVRRNARKAGNPDDRRRMPTRESDGATHFIGERFPRSGWSEHAIQDEPH